ncbi:DUF4175 domain-containing protein [Marilutibacter alkalisoli]|uniref:DUF4175 domain-containing protein n=1 Tax=Marilutibacter alkalisoli TaxID=2591633 RepID=A0A514BS96_9GAMM|nr:DUF4175 domain-containing protein [Lysobacter alkalisoli]QDH70251.1 DUF4175 domain-containing protein [Lysobacter alkalisoli]
MSWLGIVLIVLGIWLAFKVTGCLLKVLVWGLVLLCAYWLLAPLLGLPWPPWSAAAPLPPT